MSHETKASDIFSPDFGGKVSNHCNTSVELYRFRILQTKENCCSRENWPCIRITFCYLFDGCAKPVLCHCQRDHSRWQWHKTTTLQFLLQLVKLSRPFALSLQRLFESFVIFVQVSIFSFSLLSFIGMSACFVFIVVCLFCILFSLNMGVRSTMSMT